MDTYVHWASLNKMICDGINGNYIISTAPHDPLKNCMWEGNYGKI